MPFLHTPYASGKPSFAIGLAPLDPARWIEPDADLADQLALKEAILAREGAAAFGALVGAEAGQAETLELLAAHLLARFPLIYRREGRALRVRPGDRLVAFDGEPALLTASRLVQEDLLLMRRGEDGWRLVAGSLCFPSTWTLGDKLGRALDAIHAPVPAMPARWREWSRAFSTICRPASRSSGSTGRSTATRGCATPSASRIRCERFPPGEPVSARAHVRVERQTLRRLPESGDILFTVRVHVDPVSALSHDARGRRLARALHRALAALSPAELAYKGIAEARERLLAALRGLAEPPAQ